jgi:lysophospholipase L1-like esterase
MHYRLKKINRRTLLIAAIAIPYLISMNLKGMQTITVVCDGNSLTFGVGGKSYPSQLQLILGRRFQVINKGVSAQTTVKMLQDVGTDIDSLIRNSNKSLICVAWECTNDMFFGADAITAFNNFKNYCQARRASGFKVVALTVLPRSEPGTPANFESQRQILNTFLRKHWRDFADALADVAADRNLGYPGAQKNLRFYGDLVHLNEAGYRIVAKYVAQSIFLIV